MAGLIHLVAAPAPAGVLLTGQTWLSPGLVFPAALVLGGLLMLAWAWRARLEKTARLPPLRFQTLQRPPVAPTAESSLATHTPVQHNEHAAAILREARELVQALAELAESRSRELERLIAQADERLRRLHALGPPRPGPHHSDAADPLTARVYALADEGLPPVEIARRLDQHTGKIELMLALRGR